MQGIFRYSANLDILKEYLQMPILFVTVEKKKKTDLRVYTVRMLKGRIISC